MTQLEQEKYILDYVQDWAGSKQAALKWYEFEVIPALNKTAQQAVEAKDFESVKRYLEHINEGGFA
jgi:hypothetical protein